MLRVDGYYVTRKLNPAYCLKKTGESYLIASFKAHGDSYVQLDDVVVDAAGTSLSEPRSDWKGNRQKVITPGVTLKSAAVVSKFQAWVQAQMEANSDFTLSSKESQRKKHKPKAKNLDLSPPAAPIASVVDLGVTREKLKVLRDEIDGLILSLAQ